MDDHPTVRQGLGLMFGHTPDLELVGSVENGEGVSKASIIGERKLRRTDM